MKIIKFKILGVVLLIAVIASINLNTYMKDAFAANECYEVTSMQCEVRILDCDTRAIIRTVTNCFLYDELNNHGGSSTGTDETGGEEDDAFEEVSEDCEISADPPHFEYEDYDNDGCWDYAYQVYIEGTETSCDFGGPDYYCEGHDCE